MAAIGPGSVIGILGGGQLGRMLGMAAARLGFRTVILDPDPDCPANQVANHQIVASYDDRDALQQLLRQADIVTFEFENIPVEELLKSSHGPAILPPVKALQTVQDRLWEKQFLNRIGIETAAYRQVDNDAMITPALAELGGRAILKTRRFGYDGKGQRLLEADHDPATGNVYALMGEVPLILEKFIAFDREVSVIAARGIGGDVRAYDPAENVHEKGILSTSQVPSRLASKVLRQAQDRTVAIMESLDYVGVIGVEFFVLCDGALLVNEIAPRVHNSGHWTEAACTVSQFEQHIRAICGLPLGNSQRHSDCVMNNLIGDDVRLAGRYLKEAGAMVHLYGKQEVRAGRKMGHVTCLTGQS